MAKPSDGPAFGSLRRFEIKLVKKNNASVSTYFLTLFFNAVHKKLDMYHSRFHVEVVAFPKKDGYCGVSLIFNGIEASHFSPKTLSIDFA